MKPRYHLRFQIAPGPQALSDASVLAEFCTLHGVEEVVLFVAAEELNNGLLSAEEEDGWVETIRGAKGVLETAGIVVSLNPWMTVLHTDRGRRFPADRKFAPMVSPKGEVSAACASFADPGWREYIANLYGRFAELGFRVLWVEDDFRFHNHAPLTWGGGFEQAILDRFSAKVSRNATREEIVSAILKPGTPHPWRGVWMETWREVHLETAEIIARAVADRSPNSRLGLMSSHPSSHSVEGRDWTRMFDALSISGKVAHRPHFAGYSEGVGKARDWSFMMLDLQRDFRPRECEVAPEVENFPFTRWSKSDTQTWSEMALCQFFGSDALLLDVFPFTGNPASEEPEIGELLDRSRPALEWIAGRFPKDAETCGVGSVWKEDAQAHVHTVRGNSMAELNADPFVAGAYLMPYGVAVSMRRQPVTALMGASVWALSDEEIEEVLSGGTLVDGDGLDILSQRGFARHLGVTFEEWAERDSSLYSIEEVVSRKAGVKEELVFNANVLPRIAVMNAGDGAVEWTRMITPTRRKIGAGLVAFENALGGRVVTIATPAPASLPRSYQRQMIAQAAVRYIAGDLPPAMVTGGAYLMPLHLVKGQAHWLVVYNGSPDAARPVIRYGGISQDTMRATLLAPLSVPAPVADIRTVAGKDGVGFEPVCDVPYQGFLVVEWQEA